MKNKRLLSLLLALTIVLASRLTAAAFFQMALTEFTLLVAVPAAYIKLSGGKLGEYGISFGELKRGLKYAAAIFILALPLMAYGSQLSSFRGYYPIWKPAYQNPVNFIVYELTVALMLFSTEFFYRGFLLFTLNRETRLANVIHALVYALVHVGKPLLEVPYSFMAGLVFGEADLKCKSILPSFLMHFAGNLAFDLMIIYGTQAL